MSTETNDAPPLDHDATQQDGATSDADEQQVVWRVTPEIVEQWRTNPELFEQFKEAERQQGEQINAYSESILLAAFRYDADADPPAPLPSPIHPDVTTDDMRNAINVLFGVISALRDGTRHELDNLRAALDLFAVRRGDVPQGKEEQYVFLCVTLEWMPPIIIFCKRMVEAGHFDSSSSERPLICTDAILHLSKSMKRIWRNATRKSFGEAITGKRTLGKEQPQRLP